MHKVTAVVSITFKPFLTTSIYFSEENFRASLTLKGSAVYTPSTLVAFKSTWAFISLARSAAAVSVKLNGGEAVSITAGSDGSFSKIITGLKSGDNTIQVDAIKGVDSATISRTVKFSVNSLEGGNQDHMIEKMTITYDYYVRT